MVEGIQYIINGGMSSIRWKIFNTVVSHHQYGGGTSSVQYTVWTCHIINTEEGVQYMTTITAQGVIGGLYLSGKMIFYKQYNPDFVLL